MAEIFQIHGSDIADRLEAEANTSRLDRNGMVAREAAALLRDLDAAIAHMVAVKGSTGLSPWAVSVLHEAIARRQRRGDG